MKRPSIALVAAFAFAITCSALGQGNGPGPGSGDAPVGTLDATEAADLAFLREEEKLARDTYLWLYDRWGEPVFDNIADSERRHMAALARMLDLYGTDDPITDDSRGVFTVDSGLGATYAKLLERGEESLLEAYRAGAWVEELDIRDLREAIQNTDEEPLIGTYGNLLAASRNHLRAFVAHINALGYGYDAQVLTQDDVDAILQDYYQVVPNRGFVINPNLSDAWYYPGTNGQGFFLSVFPDQRKVLLAWFTYDTELPPPDASANLGDPGQRWLTAQGSYSGAMAELQVYSSTGGLFDQGDPAPIHEPVGSILLYFENCASGTVTYDLPGVGVEGIIPIERVALDNVTHCQRNNQPGD